MSDLINTPSLTISDAVEVRTVKTTSPSVTQKETTVVHRVGCEKVVLRTSYRGPQGPKGDPGTLSDFDVPSLVARFNLGLI